MTRRVRRLMFDHRTPQRRSARRHHTEMVLLLAAVLGLGGAVSIAVPSAAAATTPPAMVPACSGVHIRSGSTTASPVKLTLAANATLTVAGTVSGGSWRTICPGAKTGSDWYRVTAIGGRSVKAAYGVTSLYAATGVLTAAPTPPASSTDAFASDLMRLINLDRKALGKAPYMIDGRLAQIARDARFTCPTNHAKAFNGRARDMADRGYFGHIVPGCYSSGTTPFRSVQIVRRVFGYAGARSEILHWNSYGSTAKTTYRLGCDISGKNCKAATTTAPYTVTLAQRNFMSSAPHRAAELNSYQRFGCGTAEARRLVKDLLRMPLRRWRVQHPGDAVDTPAGDEDDGSGMRQRESSDGHIDVDRGQGALGDIGPRHGRRHRQRLSLVRVVPDVEVRQRLVSDLGREWEVREEPLRPELAVRGDGGPPKALRLAP